MQGNPWEGNPFLWLLESVFKVVLDLGINSAFCLEYLMLPFPEHLEDWEFQMLHWNAMNLMEREVQVRLCRKVILQNRKSKELLCGVKRVCNVRETG